MAAATPSAPVSTSTSTSAFSAPTTASARSGAAATAASPSASAPTSTAARTAAPSPASASSSRPLLEIDGLHVAYRGRRGTRTRVVHDVSLAVAPGEVVALVGESGSGKTTTSSAVLGLLPEGGIRESGAIRFEGVDIAAWSDHRLASVRGKRIGYIPQDPATSLNPVRRVGDQLAEVFRIHEPAIARDRRELGRRVVSLLDRVGIDDPERRARQHPHELSGGMRQRVLIAGAVALAPSLLVADEPTSALDVTVQRLVLDLIDDLRREHGTAMLLVTHDLAVAAERSDRVVVMRDGRVVEAGPTPQVVGDPQDAYARQLIADARPIESIAFRVLPGAGSDVVPAPGPGDADGDGDERAGAGADTDANGRAGTGADRSAIDGRDDRAARAGRATADEASRIGGAVHPAGASDAAADSGANGSGDALRDRSGADGSGSGSEAAARPAVAVARTADERARAVSDADLLVVEGLTKTFRVPGREPFRAVDDVSFRIRRGTTHALVGESGSGKTTTARIVTRFLGADAGSVRLDGDDVLDLRGRDGREFRRRVQLVYQNPFTSLDPRRSVRDIIAEPLANFRVGTRAERRERAAALAERVSLPLDALERRPRELSGGQRQRVAIARALAIEPELLVLDEAVSALDVTVQARILELLEELQADLGLTYLFITHDLSVVKQSSHTVSVLRRGRVVDDGPTARVFTSPRHEYTRALLSAIPSTERRPGPDRRTRVARRG